MKLKDTVRNIAALRDLNNGLTMVATALSVLQEQSHGDFDKTERLTKAFDALAARIAVKARTKFMRTVWLEEGMDKPTGLAGFIGTTDK